MGQSPFKRTSSFIPPDVKRHDEREARARQRPAQSAEEIVKIAALPKRSDLEEWYRHLNDIVQHWGHGSDDLANEVADVRDAIYSFLH